MKKLSPSLLKRTLVSLDYKYFSDKPNLIGIRSSLHVPDVFNDLMTLSFIQPRISSGLGIWDQQVFLNRFGYRGMNGKPLLEDGDNGVNTRYAFQAYFDTVGKERMLSWSITTDPGTYYLKNPLTPLGSAVLVPGQYTAWQLGFHQGKISHPALVQTAGKVKVYRDNDQDVTPEAGPVQEGFFGINIHHGMGDLHTIGRWSAGCQVFQRRVDHEQMYGILEYFKTVLKNRFTYTLLDEAQIL